PAGAVDGRQPQLPGPGVREAMRLPRRADDDVAAIDDHRLVADPERGLTGLDDEHLRVWMPVQLRTDPWLRVDEDDREGHVAVLGPDEFVCVLGVGQVVEREDRAGP